MASAFSNTLKGAITGIGFGYIAKDILDTNRQMEMLRASLTSVTGSIASGKDAFKFVQDFAINTPFEISDLTKAFITLKNFGLQPNADVMQAISDQASKLGGSAETLTGITLALGQAWAKGKLQGQEILQLINQGVPIWELLVEVTGKSTAELQKMSEKGEITRDVLGKVIVKMGELSSGSSVRAMNTLTGSISNLSDAWTVFQDTLMQDKSEGLVKSIVRNMTSAISGLTDLINSDLAGSIARLEAKIQYYQRGNLLIKGAMTAGGFNEGAATSDLERLRRAQEVESLRTLERQQNEARTADAKKNAEARMAKDAEETAAREKNAKRQIDANKKIADSWKDFDKEMDMLVFDSTQSLVADVEQYKNKFRKENEAADEKLADAIAAYNDRVLEEEKKKSETMSKYAERAAENMQDAFANFLFDPFAKGTRSMGEEFAIMLRRMAAQAAASKIFDLLTPFVKTGLSAAWGGISGLFSSGFTPTTVTAQTVSAMDFSPIRTPKFASGGYHSGGLRLVGENGPELEATGASRIYNTQQTKELLSGSGSVNNITVNVTNDGKQSPDMLGDQIAKSIVRTIAREEIANATRPGNQLNKARF
jgi:tape measure domain-containing protein